MNDKMILPAGLLLLGMCSAFGAAEGDNPLFQMRLRMNDTRSIEQWKASFEAMRQHPGCCDEVWLSTGCGVPDLDWHRANARVMSVAADDLRQAGIAPSLQFQATIGHGDGIIPAEMFSFKTWRGWTGPTGVEAKHCNCPRQIGFLDYVREVSRIYAPIGFGSVWLDDDLRLNNHYPATGWVPPFGCWCDTCLAAFNQETGGSWTRETLVAAVAEDPELLTSWNRFSESSLSAVARTIAETFKELSPKTRMGLQHCTSEDNRDQILAVLKTLHEVSGLPVGLRPGGGAYSDDAPDTVLLKTLNSCWFRDYLGNPDYVNTWTPEIESYPRTYYSISPQGVLIQGFSGLMFGLNSISYFISNPDKETPALYAQTYWQPLAAAAPCLKAYARTIRNAVPVGFSLSGRLKDVGILRGAIPVLVGPGRSVGRLTEEELALVPHDMTSHDVQKLRDALDARAGGLPARLCSPFSGLIQIHVDSSGELRALALLNARLSPQGPIRIRLVGAAAAGTTMVWQEMGKTPRMLSVEREGDGSYVTVPRVEAWNGGFLAPQYYPSEDTLAAWEAPKPDCITVEDLKAMPIPTFVKERLKATRQRILEWKGDDKTVVIPFMSDIHDWQGYAAKSNVWQSAKTHLLFLRYAAEQLKADLIGDLGDKGFDCKKTWRIPGNREHLEERIAFERELIGDYSFSPMFHIPGNHDHGSIHARFTNADFGRAFNSYPYSKRPGMVWSDCRDYGRFDSPEKQTRILFLNTTESPAGNDYGINPSQVAFVRDSVCSTPSGWSLLVFSHRCLHPSCGRWDYPGAVSKTFPGFAEVGEILKMAAKRSDIHFLGCISGDSHFDLDYTEDSVRYLISQGYGGCGKEYHPKDQPSATELPFNRDADLLIDVACIKPKTGELKIFRIGVGDRERDR